MISDVVYEQIIKKKYEGKDYLMSLLYILACLAVPSIIIFLVVLFIENGILYILSMIGYVVLVYIAAIVIAVGLVRNTHYEYEYTFVNGEMTIDKIIAKSKRKRMLVFDVKLVEEMGIYEPEKVSAGSDTTTLVYSDTYEGRGDLYLKFRHPAIGNTMLVMKSDDRLGKALKPYVKRHIHKAVYPNL